MLLSLAVFFKKHRQDYLPAGHTGNAPKGRKCKPAQQVCTLQHCKNFCSFSKSGLQMEAARKIYLYHFEAYLRGSFHRLWAIALHTFGVQVEAY